MPSLLPVSPHALPRLACRSVGRRRTRHSSFSAPAFSAEAAGGALEGVIRDQHDNVVIAGATVRLLEPADGQVVDQTTTGSGGRYSVTAPAGIYDLDVTGAPPTAASSPRCAGSRSDRQQAERDGDPAGPLQRAGRTPPALPCPESP